MSKHKTIKLLVCATIFALVFTSCKDHANEYHTVVDKIEAETKVYHGENSSEKFLEEFHTIEITEDGHTFLIPERKSQIKSFECTECHSKSLDKMQSKDAGKKAHWDLKMAHANKNTMNCVTCHDGSDMNSLKSLTGNKIDFNNSYNLCSQCHSKQFADWKGGAHGKSMGGWAPPRASLTCVNCHNPHNPSFESRWPARFNTQTEKERK